MNELKPTIGRHVYYKADNGLTCAAIITAVVTDTTINLVIFHEGMVEFKKDVQNGDTPGTWDWMSYQKATNAVNSQSAEPRPSSEPSEEEIVDDIESVIDGPTEDDPIIE